MYVLCMLCVCDVLCVCVRWELINFFALCQQDDTFNATLYDGYSFHCVSACLRGWAPLVLLNNRTIYAVFALCVMWWSGTVAATAEARGDLWRRRMTRLEVRGTRVDAQGGRSDSLGARTVGNYKMV